MIVVPDEQIPTEEARRAIPEEIPLDDAVANVAAASLSCSACSAPTSR